MNDHISLACKSTCRYVHNNTLTSFPSSLVMTQRPPRLPSSMSQRGVLLRESSGRRKEFTSNFILLPQLQHLGCIFRIQNFDFFSIDIYCFCLLSVPCLSTAHDSIKSSSVCTYTVGHLGLQNCCLTVYSFPGIFVINFRLGLQLPNCFGTVTITNTLLI